jgi:quinol monooxygenase YgiN
MGSGVSKGVAAAMAEVSDAELAATLRQLDGDTIAKLKVAVEAAPPRHVTVIMYEFKQADEGKAWYDYLLSDAADGLVETSEAPGMLVCKLYKASETRYGFYEEWDKAASQTAYTKQRFATGFLSKWLGLDVTLKPPAMTKLKEGADGLAVEQGVLVKSSVKAETPVNGCCVSSKFCFKEAAQGEAFLSHLAEAADGFMATADASGCHVCKLFKATPDATGWAPSSAWSNGYVGLYEEWESCEAQAKHAVEREKSLATWLGIEDASAAAPNCTNLVGGRPVVDVFSLTTSKST